MAEPLLPTPPAGSPRRFLLVWALGVALLALAGIPALDLLLLSWHSDPETAWVEGVARRKMVAAQLAGTTGRLLVAGGSSGLFSVDAELLEARLGRRAVNLATHAGLGLFYLLEDVRAVARPGDTVLLYLEYAQYTRKPLPLSPLERQALWTCHPERLLRLPPAEALQEIYGNPLEEYQKGWERRNLAMAHEATADQELKPYSMVEFGRCGDYRSGASSEKPAPAMDLRRLGPPRPEIMPQLDGFLRWCEQHQVQVVAARPAVVRDPAATPAEVERAYRALEPFFRERMIPLLDTREVFQLPSELFYDTEYHANAAGRRLISEALARALALRLGKVKVEESGPVLLLTAAWSEGRRDLMLAEQATVAVRFLSATDLHHPLCVTPAQVHRLCAEGREVLSADPKARELLRSEALAFTPRQRASATLGQWMQTYGKHIFLMAQVGDFPAQKLADGVPPPFQGILQSAGTKAIILGTGPYTGVNENAFQQPTSALRISQRAAWQGGFRFPASFALFSDAGRKVPIFVEHSALCQSTVPGLAVAVYDPARGTIVQRGVFTEPEFLEWELLSVHEPPP